MTVPSIGRASAAACVCVTSFWAGQAFAEEGAYFDDPGEQPAPQLAPLESTSVSEFRALLYHTARMADRDAVKAGLIGTGLFGALDIDTAYLSWSSRPIWERGPLTPEELMDYDCVYVWSGYNIYPTTSRGDELADYVDAGGGVVLAVAALARTDLPGFAIAGRITDETYSPLDANNSSLGGGARSLEMGGAALDHPVLLGVTEFAYESSGGFSAVTLDPGAVLVARDDLGVPAVAISAAGDIAAFNVGYRPDQYPSAGAFRALANACGAVTVTQVYIDIRPDDDLNAVNLASNGVIPVAIFGSEYFDVDEIDTSTLTFADAGVKMVGKKNKELCRTHDLDLDGWDDLVCNFDAVDLGALDGASTEATVKGRLTNGRRFSGVDVVNIVKE